MSTVEELRAAAAKVRAKAENAESASTGDLPWVPTGTGDVITDEQSLTVVQDAGVFDAEWIALVHPGLAEPLALWLEAEAHMCEVRPGNSAEGHTFHALKVARVINGGDVR
ncbi:hypothetical protein OG589_14810 [Sphaerisporangium sp. NBC_01403]|uniref:hypothetical protein n=1 Tax=Sphaerisporangium sp. NBC_01403 TaxID=2903599 RepID=UPI003244ED35